MGVGTVTTRLGAVADFQPCLKQRRGHYKKGPYGFYTDPICNVGHICGLYVGMVAGEYLSSGFLFLPGCLGRSVPNAGPVSRRTILWCERRTTSTTWIASAASPAVASWSLAMSSPFERTDCSAGQTTRPSNAGSTQATTTTSVPLLTSLVEEGDTKIHGRKRTITKTARSVSWYRSFR